jgi:hypothetical protein
MTIWVDFEALKSLRGEPYTDQRDRLLAAGPELRARLAVRERGPEWEDAVQAKILLGWLDHRATYEALLRDLDQEDPAAAQRTAVGLNLIWNAYADRAMHELKEVVLPLSWEAILRYADELPMWKIVAHLRMIGAAAHPLSVEPLLHYGARAPTHGLRYAAVDALSQLPRSAMETRAREAQERHADMSKLLYDLLAHLS